MSIFPRAKFVDSKRTLTKHSRPAQSHVAAEPCVGIFWWFAGRVLTDSTPLSAAEPYGDSLTHGRGHLTYWTLLQRTGSVPLDVEYEHPPRGRIGYDREDEEFFLLADKCILDRKSVVRQIMAKFNLPPDKTSVGRDDHYRCDVCLRRGHQRGQD